MDTFQFELYHEIYPIQTHASEQLFQLISIDS